MCSCTVQCECIVTLERQRTGNYSKSCQRRGILTYRAPARKECKNKSGNRADSKCGNTPKENSL